ncbi:MAG: hypothetical protein CVV24_11320 [Ignavibacteriae bacterium HGW-Ignavibacteriae-3]|nr:MAG: hypothetical protein CVV24_11320 [Ignavibacteriae bacterium HGW-Ignavibacteriae-3]
MPKLTLSMIVKNEAKHLSECLNSVRDVADEIVIVDTGSNDKTVEIAKSFGAKIYNYKWINDFSAARNFALYQSTGDFILYLDADERLDGKSIPEIKKILASDRKAAYYCTVKSYDTGGGRDTSMRYTRIFPNYKGLAFKGKVHEQIVQSLVENGIKLIQSEVLIHHYGYDVSSDDKKAKAKRNLSLLLEENKKNNSSYITFQLGQTYDILEDGENAVKNFKIAGESCKLEKQHRGICFTSLALHLHKNHQIAEAENYINRSLNIDDKQPFAYLLASKIALRKSEYNKAEEACKRAYMINKELSVKGHKSPLAIILNPEEIIYFGLLMALQNRNNANIQYYQKILFSYYREQCPQTEARRIVLIQKLLSKSSLLPEEIEVLADMCSPVNLDFIVFTSEGNPSKHQILLIAETLLKKNPDSIELRKLKAKALDELGEVEKAVLEMEKIIRDEDRDPALYFYLISYYIKLGRMDDIEPIVQIIDKYFSDIPDVVTRITPLKNAIQTLSKVRQ